LVSETNALGKGTCNEKSKNAAEDRVIRRTSDRVARTMTIPAFSPNLNGYRLSSLKSSSRVTSTYPLRGAKGELEIVILPTIPRFDRAQYFDLLFPVGKRSKMFDYCHGKSLIKIQYQLLFEKWPSCPLHV
jgi:hypothetical protein